MEKDIIRTIKYFNTFSYSPDINELFLFLNTKTDKKKLHKVLKTLIFNKKIVKKGNLYTRGEYNKGKLEIRNSKFEITQKKLNNWKFRAYIKLISLFPQIKLVGLSGSISMMNAKEDDDFDLFIITAKNRIFTSRLIALALAQSLGLRRSRDSESLFSQRDYKNKVCLNLFFDETKLNIPNFKKNYYIAHEIIQMKPIFDRKDTYARFLNANTWVFRIFPNARALDTQFLSRKGALPRFLEGPNSQKLVSSRPRRNVILNPDSIGGTLIEDLIENILKRVQIFLINRHRTTEIVTNKQLWFFPEDFEEKLPKFARKRVG